MVGALAGVHASIEVEQHRLARRHVADALKIERVQRHAFGGDHVFHAILGRAGRTPAAGYRMGRGRHQAEADDQRHGGVGARTRRAHRRHRSEDILGIDRQLAALLQFVSEYVEQDFRVGIGVDGAGRSGTIRP